MHEERYRYKLTVDCMMYCRHFAHAAAAAASLSCSSGGRCAPRVCARSVQYWLFINPPGIIANLTIPILPHANFVAYVSFASLHWRKNYYFKRSNSVAKLPPLCVDVQKLCNMCVLSLSWNFFVSHDKCIARPSSRATLIHRQYNRDWGTSYSRPPIDPYLTSPCYEILAAPLVELVNILTTQPDEL